MLSYEQVAAIAQRAGEWSIEEEALTPECIGTRSQLWLVKGKERILLGDTHTLREMSMDDLRNVMYEKLAQAYREAGKRMR
jgi:hypothetical protein